MNALQGDINGKSKSRAGRKRTLSNREKDHDQVMNAILSGEEAGESDSTSESSSGSSGSSDCSSTSSSGSSSSDEGTMEDFFEEDECGRYIVSIN